MRTSWKSDDPNEIGAIVSKVTTFTAEVDVTHIEKMLRRAETPRGHQFHSDEQSFGGADTAPEPLEYFTAATGF